MKPGVPPTISSRGRIAGLVAAAGILCATATSQGPWAGNMNAQLFVDAVNGIDDTTMNAAHGTLFQTPFQTIQAAVDRAELLMAGSLGAVQGLPVTINLIPAAPFVVTQPILIPALGISIESAGPGLAAVQGAAQAFEVFDVDRTLAAAVLNASPGVVFPATVIRGLDISDGSFGIRVRPQPTTAFSPTISMEIRDCDIHDNFTGVMIDTPMRNETVVEHNRIFHNQDPLTTFGNGLRVRTQSVSSSLIRANRIWDNEVNLELVNITNDAFNSRDRVFSNFIELGEFNVDMTNTAALLRSNTIAFAVSFSAPPLGIVYRNSGVAANPTLELRNNIVWHPGVDDIRFFGLTAPQLLVTTNDLNAEPAPLDAITRSLINANGNFMLAPPFAAQPVPENLHLQPIATSPAIWGGADATFVHVPVPAPNTFANSTILLAVAGQNVRVDIPCDVDLDSRTVRMAGEPALTSDIGADEIVFSRLVSTARLDPLGNLPFNLTSGLWDAVISVVPDPAASAPLPPLTAAFLFMSLEPDPVNVHFFLNPVGSAQLNLGNVASLFALPAAGSTQVDFNLNFGALNFAFLEGEVHLQAGALTANDLMFTNRVTVALSFQ